MIQGKLTGTSTKKNLRDSYSIEELFNLGEQYNNKIKSFDYNALNAMYFYYNAHRKAQHDFIDSDDYAPQIIQLGKDSYYKFKKIKNQLSSEYIDLANYIPFDESYSEDY